MKSPILESTKRTRPTEDRDEQADRILAKRKRLAELKGLRERRSQARASLLTSVLEDNENIREWGAKTFELVLSGEALKIQDSITSQGAGISLSDTPFREEPDSSALTAVPIVESSQDADQTETAVKVGIARLLTSNTIL